MGLWPAVRASGDTSQESDVKRAARIIRRLLAVGLITLVITIFGIVLTASVGSALGHDLVVIRSGSMAPAIPSGAVADVVTVSPGGLRVGDVITLNAPNGVVDARRIAGVIHLPYGLFIQTKSDANRDPDPELSPASAVTGRVDFSAPALGYLMYMLTIPTGILSVFGLALTMLLAIWLLGEYGKVEKEKGEPVPYEMPGLTASLPPTNEFPPRTKDWIG
jgi:signal peptidase I